MAEYLRLFAIEHPNGKYPYDQDIFRRCYIEVHGWKASLKECPEGTLFDSKKRECRYRNSILLDEVVVRGERKNKDEWHPFVVSGLNYGGGYVDGLMDGIPDGMEGFYKFPTTRFKMFEMLGDIAKDYCYGYHAGYNNGYSQGSFSINDGTPPSPPIHIGGGWSGGGGSSSGDSSSNNTDNDNKDTDDKKDKVEKIIDKLTNPCMKSVLTNLKSLTKGVGYIVKKFAGNEPGYNWELKNGSLTGATGSTNPPALYNKSTGTITTTFDSKAWSNATDLSWARTMLHEAVHAYLVVYFKVDKPNWIATYPKMVAEWGKLQSWNDVHHEEIARSLVKDIASALKEYGKIKGYNLTNQFCQDMAWGGLQNTSTFKNLPPAEQKRILDTISTELTGMDISGNNKKQKGKNYGC